MLQGQLQPKSGTNGVSVASSGGWSMRRSCVPLFLPEEEAQAWWVLGTVSRTEAEYLTATGRKVTEMQKIHICALRRLRQEECKLEAIYTVRSRLKRKKKEKENKNTDLYDTLLE